MSDWFKQNSHALILLALVCIMLVYSLHVMHAKDVDATTMAWCRENTGLVLGGLLTLLTGAAKSVSISKPDNPDNTVTAPPAVIIPNDLPKGPTK